MTDLVVGTRAAGPGRSTVVISGHHNVITLTGACGEVFVPGDDSRVSMGDAAHRSVSGDNTLTVRRVDFPGFMCLPAGGQTWLAWPDVGTEPGRL